MLRLHILALSELAKLHDHRMAVTTSPAALREAELRRHLADLRREPRKAVSTGATEAGLFARLRLVIGRDQAS